MLNVFIIAAIVGTIPLIVVFPFTGVLAWHWIAFMNPHRLGWGGLGLPPAMVVGAATLMFWLISREPKVPPRDTIVYLLVTLAAWISITTVFAIAPNGANPIWERAIKILLFALVTCTMVTTVHRLHGLIWVIVLSMGFFSIKGGLFVILTGGNATVFGPPNSFIGENNALAMAILMTLPLFWYLKENAELPLMRWVLLIAFILSVFAVIGSYSRGAFLALVAVAAFFALNSRHKFVYISIGIGLLAVFAVFVPPAWIAEMQSIANFEDDPSAQGRFDAWLFALRLVGERPILGGGFRAYYDDALFMALVPDAATARAWHSNYFQILGEHGIIGFIIFASIFLFTWRRSSDLVRIGTELGRQWPADLGRMCKVSLVAYASAGVFLNMAFFDLYYAIVVIVVSGYQVIAQERPGAETTRRGLRWRALPASESMSRSEKFRRTGGGK